MGETPINLTKGFKHTDEAHGENSDPPKYSLDNVKNEIKVETLSESDVENAEDPVIDHIQSTVEDQFDDHLDEHGDLELTEDLIKSQQQPQSKGMFCFPQTAKSGKTRDRIIREKRSKKEYQ